MQCEQNKIKNEIKLFIQKNILKNRCQLSNDTALFDTNILDSIVLLRLINHIEHQYQIVINPMEIIIDNFNNINTISNLIEEKLR